jgi:hypothetical protein
MAQHSRTPRRTFQAPIAVTSNGAVSPLAARAPGALLTAAVLALGAVGCGGNSEGAPVDDSLGPIASSGVDAGTEPAGTEFELLDAYEPAADQPGSSAIAKGDTRFVAWATGYVMPFDVGSDVDDGYGDPEQALGPAEGNALEVTSLGNGGSLVLTFARPLRDGPGFDFAVFENSFSDDFLELAFVEVSSDGAHFVRFDCAYLGSEPVSQYGTQRSELIGGLAGKYRAGFGTPFDLAQLQGKAAVRSGDVDLQAITHVKVIDIIGDGSEADSFGHPIYDPTPTVGSGGFDLDAIGVLNRD